MNRRAFITLCTMLLTQNIYGEKNISPTPWDIIGTTLQHLFPKSNNFAGSKNLGIDQFIKIISEDIYFDKSDLEFLIFGAKKLFSRNQSFLSLNNYDREKALREFEKEYQNWLSLLIYYGLEGMLSDPIYGGNKAMLGYKALKHSPGLPRPKSKYGK